MEHDVIDNPIFQRLRRIRQLAGAHLTYPGGQHSRFEHALGAMHLAGLAGRSLASKTQLNEEQIVEIRLAALLHDIGHGPFSHTFEEVLAEKKGVNHEDMTVKILKETEIKDILSKHGFDSSAMGRYAIGLSENKPRFMNDVIGGSLSVDLMDYLLRDSHFTGVEYGKVDVQRILDSYEVVDGKLAIDQAALYAIEALIIARYEMFRAVYFHRTVRAAEIMLAKAMEAADDELGLTDISKLPRFLALTDEATLAKLTDLKTNGNSELEKARKYAIGYRDRKLLKCVFEKVVYRKDSFIEKIFSQKKIREEIAIQIAHNSGVKSDEIHVDVPTTPSVPFTSSREALSSLILVQKEGEKKHHRTVSINEMPLVGAISGFFDILRIYTNSGNREAVSKAASKFFGQEGYMSKISI